MCWWKRGRGQFTWVESKVIDEALPGDEGDLLDGGGGASEAQLLQVQQGVDERTAFMQQLSSTDMEWIYHQSQLSTHLL